MPQKPVHEQKQDEEQQSVPQTIHENSQEVRYNWRFLVSWHGGYMLILFCRSTSL